MADSNAVLQSILPNLTQGQQSMMSTKNPATNLTNSQAEALQSVLNAKDKQDAKEAIAIHGVDPMRQLLDAHYSTSVKNDQTNIDSNINASQQGQTSLPTQVITTPADPSNTQQGNFEIDKPTNAFEKIFGRPQVFKDNNGVVHYKPGGIFGASANQDALDQVKSIQSLSGSEPIQPVNSIAYQVEQAKQQAEKVPMNQSQKAEYNLNIQQKGLEIANQQVQNFSNQNQPVLSSLQKIDQLIPLGQAAANGDRSAQASLIAGAKELYGQAGNILGQGPLGKLQTYLTGKYDPKMIPGLLDSITNVRKAMITKLAANEKIASNSIGNLQIGDHIIPARSLLNHPYSAETSYVNNNFSNQNEANKASADLTDGTPVMIGGKKYIWQKGK